MQNYNLLNFKLRHFLYILLIVSIGCNNRANDATESPDSTEKNLDTISREEKEVEKIVPILAENFDEFYKKFNEDLEFQNKRIKYPLKGENYDGNSPEGSNPLYYWTLKDSLDFDNLKLDSTTYKVERKVSDTLVIEKVIIPNSGFKIESHFKRENNIWYLIWLSYIVV